MIKKNSNALTVWDWILKRRLYRDIIQLIKFTAYRAGVAKSFQAYKAVFFLDITNFSIPFLNLLGWSFEVDLKLEGSQSHSLVQK